MGPYDHPRLTAAWVHRTCRGNGSVVLDVSMAFGNLTVHTELNSQNRAPAVATALRKMASDIERLEKEK